ncbi:hypothetical protein HYPSUDRAFT_202047 [Hypholoma sublateritium FD-334 SS-4]|uniref:Uncharacterized protein n=1 Tax=Hypholoma sublateritium (strain FD-334 SS-4) TaxID=945553 RepID=A0A0D2P178_HYPSF|nr:hypothetical protein HYPSUDRAFT_202047 [Hypholoma sublateritium FD-334 SS-4]
MRLTATGAIPGGYRSRKYVTSAKTFYRNQGRTGPPLRAIKKTKDVNKTVVEILYANPADQPTQAQHQDIEDFDESDVSDTDTDDSFKTDTPPPSSVGSGHDDDDDGSDMDITPPPNPDFRRRRAVAPHGRRGAAAAAASTHLGPHPRNIIDLTLDDN